MSEGRGGNSKGESSQRVRGGPKLQKRKRGVQVKHKKRGSGGETKHGGRPVYTKTDAK